MIDQGTAIIAAGLLAILGGVAGGAFQYILSEQRRRDDRTYLDAKERRARVREYDLRRIDHTRRQLERTRQAVLGLVAGRTTIDELSEVLEHADMRVVGDARAASRWSKAVRSLADGASRQFEQTGRLPTRMLTDEENKEIVEAREAVMHALDVQERRVLADEPLLLTSVPAEPSP